MSEPIQANAKTNLAVAKAVGIYSYLENAQPVDTEDGWGWRPTGCCICYRSGHRRPKRFSPTTCFDDAMEALEICYLDNTNFDRRQSLIDVVQLAVRPSASIHEGWKGEEFHPEEAILDICKAILIFKGTSND